LLPNLIVRKELNRIVWTYTHELERSTICVLDRICYYLEYMLYIKESNIFFQINL